MALPLSFCILVLGNMHHSFTCIFILQKILMGLYHLFVLVALTFVFISSKLQYSTVAASRKYYKDIFELLVFPSLWISVISKLPDSQEMKQCLHNGSFFVIFSFEGVVAYQIRYSIIAFDHSDSVLYSTLIGKTSLEQRHLYTVWCVGVSVHLYVFSEKSYVWLCEWAEMPLRLR